MKIHLGEKLTAQVQEGLNVDNSQGVGWLLVMVDAAAREYM